MHKGSQKGELDFFIAYCTDDKESAEIIYQRLEEMNYNVFKDKPSLGYGDNWMESIGLAIEKSRIVLVLVNKTGNLGGYQSREVIQAIELAEKEGSSKKVIPFVLKGGRIENLPLVLKSSHGIFLDDFNNIDDAIGNLIENIGDFLSKEEKPSVLMRAFHLVALRTGMKKENVVMEILRQMANKEEIGLKTLEIDNILRGSNMVLNQNIIIENIEKVLEKEGAGVAIRIKKEGKRYRLENSFRKAFGYDCICFPFYFDENLPEDIYLQDVVFSWIKECPCQSGLKGYCDNKSRIYNPICVPESVLLKGKENLTSNLNIPKVHKFNFGHRGDKKINVVICKSKYSDFRATHYLEELLPKELRKDFPLECSPKVNQLGFTVWLVQVDKETKKPVKTIVGWRGNEDDKGTILTGYNQYEGGTASQIKLYTKGEEHNKKEKRHHCERNGEWELPSFQKAVLVEIENEAGIEKEDLGRIEVIGKGFTKYKHPEILVLAETTKELKTIPPHSAEKRKLAHGEEFKAKLAIPYRENNLNELARLLLGLPPKDKLVQAYVDDKNFKWLSQAATAAVLATDMYFGLENLRKEFENVFENEIAYLTQ